MPLRGGDSPSTRSALRQKPNPECQDFIFGGIYYHTHLRSAAHLDTIRRPTQHKQITHTRELLASLSEPHPRPWRTRREISSICEPFRGPILPKCSRLTCAIATSLANAAPQTASSKPKIMPQYRYRSGKLTRTEDIQARTKSTLSAGSYGRARRVMTVSTDWRRGMDS